MPLEEYLGVPVHRLRHSHSSGHAYRALCLAAHWRTQTLVSSSWSLPLLKDSSSSHLLAWFGACPAQLHTEYSAQKLQVTA